MNISQLISLLVVVSFTIPANAQTDEMTKAKMGVAEILKNRVEIYDKRTKLRDTPKNILVLEDKFEFKIKNQNVSLYFADLLDDPIISTTPKNKGILELKNFYFISSILGKGNYDKFIELRKNLVFIQKQVGENQYSAELTRFEPIAAQYRSLKVKPVVSEEQRKYIVQANLLSQQKNYEKAIELYNKAIDLDQTGYSPAYSNAALLSARIKKFRDAIYYMKKYLMLEPEATDARSSKDQIYEWEIQITK